MLDTKYTNQLNLKNKSDPMIYVSDNPFNAEELVNKYRERAHNKLMQKIKKKTGITNKSELNKYSMSIINKTEAKMKETYELEDPINIEKYFVESAKTDFIDWFMMIASIPLYQSLGDTIGYRNGDWEFNHKDQTAAAGPEYANTMIAEFIHLGGINKLSIVNWTASDDTVLYLLTYVVLMQKIPSVQAYGEQLRRNYVNNWDEIKDRAPGQITSRSIQILQNPEVKWNSLNYDPTAIGNGSCMRTGCVGIFYPGKSNRKKLIALAVEGSRVTHNSATAILGSITTALFTAYAIERVPIAHWPHRLLKLLNSLKINSYMEKSKPSEYKLFLRDKQFYIAQWQKYVSFRFAGASVTPRTDRRTMHNPVERIKYFAESYSKNNPNNPGGSADDACIIAYDALLESGDNLEKLLVYSILHHGDSDTVGSIAFSWFGAYYFSKANSDLTESRFKQLEYYKGIEVKTITALRTKLIKVYYHDLFLHFSRKFVKKIPINPSANSKQVK